MTTLVKGVAHVSFVGGGTFLPARNPDDRQTLVEYVADRVRATGQVQVLVDGQRWLVEPHRPSAGPCAACRNSLDCPCFAGADRGAACCLQCAFGGHTGSVRCAQDCQTCPAR
jgi:hypothetical protein